MIVEIPNVKGIEGQLSSLKLARPLYKAGEDLS
jgi:hypothetical protein